MMTVTHTICPSCSVGCGINLITKDKKVVGTYPYKRHPVNQGKNCLRGREYFKILGEETRLTTPLIKKGNLVDSDWEEVLNLAAVKIRSYKGDEIGIIASGNCTNEECEILKKFADALEVGKIGYNNHNFPKFDFETGTLDDLEKSQFILVIGNILKDNPLLGRRIILARENGAGIIAADYPEKTTTGINADEYVQIKSIREFLDNIGSEVQSKLDEHSTIVVGKLDQKEELDDLYKIASKSNSKLIPVMDDCNSRGAMNIVPALDTDDLKVLVESVKLLYVVGDDPVSYTAESFKGLDFLITQSPTINNTTLLSDVVLPGACWAEKSGSFTNSTGNTQKIQQIVPVAGDAQDDVVIIQKIAEKLDIKL
ncbi:molybdopterin-dependent oxidoreductase [uncultured Methanobacterium sp.]|uniref:molybdopterin oxidoreductase family protein n=1 Tax=uncultured Methanobacterium sp. TaxID=176306 RepID=UPI002AA61536|nr:molybdopterin-dependent oxidoreductase [uncultured Methanobacterium sp.]